MVPMPYPIQPESPALYQPLHRRNVDNDLLTKVTNLGQQLGKMNSLLKNFIVALQTQGLFPTQPQQNPKPTNCIEETHEQIQVITIFKSGKEIDKTIAPKWVN